MLGNSVAIIMAFLHSFRLLPGLQRTPDSNMHWSVWSLSGGFLAVLLVLLLWKPRRRVFLDRICISEDNRELKALAIFSNVAARALFL